MTLKCYLVCILVTLVVQAQCNNPANVKDTGIRLRLNQGGVDLLKDLAFDLAEALGRNQPIAPLNRISAVGFGTTVEYRLIDTIMTSLKFNNRSLILSEPNIFILTSHNSELNLEGKWETITRFGNVQVKSFNGSFTSTMNNIRTLLNLKSSLADGGPIELNTSSCDFVGDSFVSNVTNENGTQAADESQTNIGFYAMNEQQMATTRDSCGSFIPSAVQQVNALLNQVPDSFQILTGYYMDLDITEEPSVVSLDETSKVVEIGVSGLVANTDNFTLGTLPAIPALPAFTESSASAQAVISEQVINTLLQTAFDNSFSFVFVANEISFAGLPLNQIIPLFVPQLAPYQDDTMYVVISLAQVPTFKVNNGSVMIGGDMIVSFDIQTNETYKFTALTVNLDLNATGRIIGLNDKLVAVIDNYEFNLALVANNLDTNVDINTISTVLQASKEYLKIQVNTLLQQGLAIPELFSLRLTSIAINMKESALEVMGQVTSSIDLSSFSMSA